MLLHYSEIIRYQVYAHLKAEAARGCLGILWWIVEPLLYMATFFVVFGVVLKRGGEGFVPFLLVGLTAWKWFATSLMQGTSSILSGARLMNQVYLPKQIFLLVTLLVNFIKFLIIFVILIFFLLFSGESISLYWTALPAIILSQFLLIMALSGFFAAICPFFPDLKMIIQNVVMVGLFVSGVFFDIHKAKQELRFLFDMNPMALLIDSYRSVLLRGAWPNWNDLLVVSACSVLVFFFVNKLIKRNDCIYPKVVI